MKVEALLNTNVKGDRTQKLIHSFIFLPLVMDEEKGFSSDFLILPEYLDSEVAVSASSTCIYPMVGRIISDKELNSEEVVAIIRKEWTEPVYGKVDIKYLNNNKYVFSFNNAALAEKVRQDGPWTIKGHFLCLNHWETGMDLEMVCLTHIPIWVQVHGHVPSYICEENAKKLGNCIGEFLKVDQETMNPGLERGFFRVQVLLNCYDAVRSGKWVTLIDRGRMKHYVEFKYENMAKLCCKCGRFGHSIDECEKTGIPHPQYGPWLKATKADDKLLAPTIKSGDQMDKQPNFKLKDEDWNCLLDLVLIVAFLVLGMYFFCEYILK